MDEREELLALTDELIGHGLAYYENDDPFISDYEYDEKLRRLERLEAKYPDIARENSPTKTVGGKVLDKFESVAHKVPLDSLQDVFSEEELFAFDERVRAVVPEPEYVVEPKVDGLSVVLEFEGGRLARGVTRGDGSVGEDVTENIKTIKSIPRTIEFKGPLIVRGEVFMPKSVFERLNTEREAEGRALFANPRNAAAGSMRQLDSRIAASRKLDIILFNIQLIDGMGFWLHTQALDFLKNLGFHTIDCQACTDIFRAAERIKRFGELRHGLEYVTDGAVVKVNRLDQRIELGRTSKYPKWAAAYKYPPEVKQTVMEAITVQVGRTGVLTPKAVVSPVSLAGTTVTNATLHNQDFIDEKDIRISDTVKIRKAGEIIPEILEVVLEKRNPDSVPYRLPEICPACGSAVRKDEDGPALRCTSAECPAQLHRNLIHFASKDAMDIDGMGQAVAKLLMDSGLIRSPSDLYELDYDRVAQLEGMGRLSAENLKNAVESSKQNDLYRLIYALGIRQVGVKAAKALASAYGTLDNLIAADAESLKQIRDIGSVTTDNIIVWFQNPQSMHMIQRLKQAGVNMTAGISRSDDRFTGMTFVVTGTLERYKRDEIEAIIESMGGKASGSVSKKTSYLIAGDNAGSKLKKANELGIEVLTEEDFLSMIN